MKYRPEIDGLRAIAVLPVIFFHAGFKAFEGGYVGVDVFFVISGYLITTIILSDMDQGKFSIVTFYERRARRILPALFFIILCCIPFAWLWLLPDRMKDFGKSIMAVIGFSSNIFFWLSEGYFAAASEMKPLLHTWSLSVEEQFYLLFPLFLMVLWKFKLRKRWVFLSLVMLALGSLLISHIGAYKYPRATFFLLPTRGWELAIGALIAYYFLYKKDQTDIVVKYRLTCEFLGLFGLFMVICSVFTFTKSTPFPSLYALVPTIGTGLIIIFSTSNTIVGRLLSNKIMVGIGLISYSAYLWHQPLFAFARHKIVDDLSTELLLVLSVCSIVLAFISWRFVEIPFRNKGTFSRRTVFAFAITGSMLFAAIGFAGNYKNGFPHRFDFPDGLDESYARPPFSCSEKDSAVDDFSCGLGDKTKKPIFFLFGDSHAGTLHDAFDTAAMNLGISGRSAYLLGCPPLLEVNLLNKQFDNDGCKAINKKIFDSIVTNNIKNVFLAARWNSYTDTTYYKRLFPYLSLSDQDKPSVEKSRKSFVHGFKKTMQKYKELGVSVFIITQIPSQKFHPKQIYKFAYEKTYSKKERIKILHDVSVSNDDHLKVNQYVSGVFNSNNYPKILSLDKVFCGDKKCFVGNLEVSYYNDEDHLGVVGAKLLIPNIQSILASELSN